MFLLVKPLKVDNGD